MKNNRENSLNPKEQVTKCSPQASSARSTSWWRGSWGCWRRQSTPRMRSSGVSQSEASVSLEDPSEASVSLLCVQGPVPRGRGHQGDVQVCVVHDTVVLHISYTLLSCWDFYYTLYTLILLEMMRRECLVDTRYLQLRKCLIFLI